MTKKLPEIPVIRKHLEDGMTVQQIARTYKVRFHHVLAALKLANRYCPKCGEYRMKTIDTRPDFNVQLHVSVIYRVKKCPGCEHRINTLEIDQRFLPPSIVGKDKNDG